MSNIDTFWYFVCERMNLFWNKREFPDEPELWTDDEKLKKGAYTNVYRVLDRVSQYLLQHVIYDGVLRDPQRDFFRIMLFKLFNSPETWESLPKHMRELPRSGWGKEWTNLDTHFESLYSKGKIFRGAYIMPSAYASQRPHCVYSFRAMLEILHDLLSWKGGDINAVQQLRECDTMEQAYNVLRKFPGIGPFLAYQFVADLNYAWGFWDEDEFVALGPGARRGVDLCFQKRKNWKRENHVMWCCDNWHLEIVKRDLVFHDIGRPPRLIDVQNCFCEFQKYIRPDGPKKDFHFGLPPIPRYMFPRWWRISSF